MKTVHLFGRMNQDDADKDIPNNEIRYAKNLMPAKRSNGLRRELVRGNVNLLGSEVFFQDMESSSNAFDLSTIEVIGSFASTDSNVLYVFYKNPNYIVRITVDSSGNHQYKYIPYENRFIWNFSSLKSVHNISLINDKLHWCQSNGEQYIIDINKEITLLYPLDDFTGGSISKSRKLLYLQKLPPVFAPRVEGINTGEDTDTKNRENLEDKSLMFAYRFIYDTDDISTFSPWSDAKPAFRIKKDAIKGSDITDALEEYNLNPRYYEIKIGKSKIQGNVKAIEYASIDQEDNFSIFKRLDRKDEWIQDISTIPDIIVEYKGNELEEPLGLSESIKIQQPNPFNPKTSVGFNDRIFQCGGEVGLPYNGNAGITFGFNLISNPYDTYLENGMTKLWSRKPLFKSGGVYKVGLQFFDENFKRSFVHASREIQIPTPSDYQGNERYELTLQSFGDVPEWAKYYQFLRSDITNYITYTTTKGILFNYVSENSENTTLEANQFVWQDRVYRAEANPIEDDFAFTHLLLPNNLPFEIDNTYKLRFLNDDLYGEEFPIIDIIGNIAVIAKTSKADTTLEYIVEVFKESFDDTQVLNEVGQVYHIQDWGNSHKVPGDCYVNTQDMQYGASLVFDNFNPTQGSNTFTQTLKDEILSAERRYSTTSQTTTLRQNTGATTRLETEAEKTGEEFKLKNVTALEWGLQLLGPIGAAFNIFNKAGVEPVFKNKIVQKYANMVVNYDLAISSKGRPNLEYKSERVVKLDNTIYFSDPFVQGSKINGLSNFQGNNNYNLPSERGPVVTLVPIDSSNVILALHPRKTTSLYIGEGFIRQGNDSILAKTEGVIGDDRPLRGDYGTTNPESVCVYNGTAVWWDQNKKEMIRYNNNGLTPLGLVYKMRTYFDEWGTALENSNVNIISGYDPYYESFFMKFPAIGNKQSETIYFSNIPGKEGFIGVVEHEGESFTILQNEMISLYEDKIFKSKSTKDFYDGPRPEVSLEFVHNEEPMISKIYESIAQNSDVPFYTEISNEKGQETNMITDDFRQYEDTYYSEVLRDTNTFVEPSAPPIIKLRDGDLIKGQSATIKLSSSEATQLNEVVIESVPATGQYT